jgi:dGTPase
MERENMHPLDRTPTEDRDPMDDPDPMDDLEKIRFELERLESEHLSPWGTRSRDAVRKRSEPAENTGYRQSFSQDTDRILHSMAYTRYIDKTQVFSLIQNDHLTHRVLHVQLVSKVARTIGRFLGLNEDLIEAVALGHDIGHTPFGHDGERILSRLCRESGIGEFHHNVQSVQFLEKVEKKGYGWNLCLQTLDGILCHDGEVHNRKLTPRKDKTFDILENEMERKKHSPDVSLLPMTLEGCVVRMADTISYIGRDLEDAIRIRMVRRSDIPKEVADVIGETNGTIVFNLVTDVIRNSHQAPHVAFSREVSGALEKLKKFNLEHIYLNPAMKRHLTRVGTLFEMLFTGFLKDLKTDNRNSVVFTHFLKDMAPEYREAHRPEEIARDFIAGMTDRYFIRLCPEHMRPATLVID